MSERAAGQIGSRKTDPVRGLGLDFGTTNCALALAEPDRSPRIAEFESLGGTTRPFRSVLFFGRDEDDAAVDWAAGPIAIERYLEHEGERRLMQSLKSFLASRLFKATNLFGRTTTLEDLIGKILKTLRDQSGLPTNAPVVVGRPVRFAKARDAEDDDFALLRLSQSLTQAGFADVVFEYEPVAAAHHYEQRLDRDELVLIADFGGGTSDFCLLPVGPSLRGRRRQAEDILGTEGVAVAGDAFDAKIVRNVIAPRLGRGSRHRTLFASDLPVPAWIYADLERWHHLSFLKSHKTMGLLFDLREGAFEPEKIDALIHIVQEDLGFRLYQAVELAKRELSEREATDLRFSDETVQIEAPIARDDFEHWIADELEAIAACVDRLLERTGIDTQRVDRVFMTGGSSFVPAVRRIFHDRFGVDRVRSGDELVSVASGLALRALDMQA